MNADLSDEKGGRKNEKGKVALGAIAGARDDEEDGSEDSAESELFRRGESVEWPIPATESPSHLPLEDINALKPSRVLFLHGKGATLVSWQWAPLAVVTQQ